jgi:hypothetical protein
MPWSHLAESNCGPPLYESGALPTELRWRRLEMCCLLRYEQVYFIRKPIEYVVMRLAVVGPQNTGKTTFIEDFITAFPHYKTPRETYRDVIHKHKLKINQETSEESQLHIRDFIYNQIKNFHGEDVIFDRSLLDNYVYSLAKYNRGEMRKRFIDETKKMMHSSLTHIDRLILIPTAAGVGLVNDKLRDIDRLYIDYINRLFVEEVIDLARQSPIPIWVISGDRETRIKLISEKLNLKLKPKWSQQSGSNR